jgi:hypothetical protein
LHSIGADKEANVYGTLLPQPAVAPHALGTGRRSVGRGAKIDHYFVPRQFSAGSGFPFPLT